MSSYVLNLNKSVEPHNFHGGGNDGNWVCAKYEEMKALNTNDNRKIIEGRKVIGCKWIYKIKYKYNGEIKCYKAQLVVKGYSRCEF